MPEPRWRLFFLNAGDGDAIYIEQANGGFNLLVDGGLPDPTLGGRYPYRLSAGEFLRTRGVKRLDILIASHFHADHAGGLAAVVAEVAVGEFWYGYEPDAAALALEVAPEPGWGRLAKMMVEALAIYRHLVGRAKAKGIRCRQVTAGAEYAYAGGGCRLRCLHPDAAALAAYDERLRQLATRPGEAAFEAAMRTMNAVSMALDVSLDGCRLLLPADAPAVLLGPRADGACDVLKLAHHGGADGVDAAMLGRLRPRRVVISAARDSLEFPHPATRALLAGFGCQVHHTDEDERPYLEFAITRTGCALVGGR